MNDYEIIKFENKTFYGYKKCPRWLKELYRKWAKYICQDCKKSESEVGTLEPHRIIRGVEGGLYTFVPFDYPISNVKMLCHTCHERYNYSRKTPPFTTKKKEQTFINL